MKYTYFGMTIPEYCEKHNLSSESIYKRIYYIRKKNPNLTPKEIMSIVFGSERSNKYIYHGMSIKEYCAQKNISSESLYRRIHYLKKLNPTLSPEELITLAIEGKDFPKYIYKGKPLAEYCAEHNVSFKTIYEKLCKLRKANPTLSTEELITLAFQKKPHPNTKYIHQGISLYEYCIKNEINIHTIYARMKKIKNENPELTLEEVVNEALTRNFVEENAIYFWNDTTLSKYCKEHPEISFKNIRSWIRNELDKNPHQSIEILINNYLNGLNNKNRWFYLEIPLKTFCDNNDISYESIRSYLFKMLRNPKYSNWSDNELVTYLVEKRFLINGNSLKNYCLSINFSYETMHELLIKAIKNHPTAKFRTILISTISTINQYYLINYQKIKHYPEEINNYLKDSTNYYLKNSYNLSRIMK